MINIIIDSVDRDGQYYSSLGKCFFTKYRKTFKMNGFNCFDYNHKFKDIDGYFVYPDLENFYLRAHKEVIDEVNNAIKVVVS